LYVADTNKTKVSKIRRSYPKVNIVNSKIIHTLSVDVYMPCALGNEFTDKNIDTLKTKLIVGGANNQLVKDSLAEKLHLKNIWYIPDYVVNAGGLIHIVDALDKKGYNEKRVDTRIESIGVTVKKLVTSSLKEGLCPLTIADMLVEKKIYEKTKQKQR